MKVVSKSLIKSEKGSVELPFLRGRNHLIRARNVIPTDLNASAYARAIMDDEPLMMEVSRVAKKIYGREMTVPEFISRAGMTTTKNLVNDFKFAKKAVKNVANDSYKLRGIPSTKLNAQAYVKEIMDNDELVKELSKKSQHLFGEVLSVPRFVTKAGMNTTKSIVDEFKLARNKVGKVTKQFTPSNYLYESRNKIPTSLNASLYAKSIIKDRKLHRELVRKSRLLYGKSMTVPEFISRAGMTTTKNLVNDFKFANKSARHLTEDYRLVRLPAKKAVIDVPADSYLHKAVKMLSTDVDKQKYVKSVMANKDLVKEISKRSNLMFGKRVGVPEFTVRANINTLKNIVEDSILTSKRYKGFSDGGEVFREFDPPDMLPDQTIEEYNKVFNEYRDKYNAEKKAFEKKHKKGFFSRLFGGKSRKAVNKKDFSTTIIDRIKKRNKMFEEVASYAVGGVVSQLALAKRNEYERIKSYRKAFVGLSGLTNSDEAEKIKEAESEMVKARIASSKEAIEKIELMQTPITNDFLYSEFGATKSYAGKRWRSNRLTSTGVMTNRGIMRYTNIVPEDRFSKLKRLQKAIKGYISSNEDSVDSFLKSHDVFGAGVSNWDDKSPEEKDKIKNQFLNSVLYADKLIKDLDKVGGLKATVSSPKAANMFSRLSRIYNSGLLNFYTFNSKNKRKQRYISKYGKDAFKNLQDMAKRGFSDSTGVGPVEANPSFINASNNKIPYAYTLDSKRNKSIQELLEEIRKNSSNNKVYGEVISRNNNSNQVRHTGGIVNSTGTYFLEKGELVVSKNFKNGGEALSDSLKTTTGINRSSKVEIQGIDELQNMVDGLSKVVDRLEKIKINDIKVDGLDELTNLKIEGLDNLRDIKIEGLDDLRDIRIEGIDNLKDIKVIGADNLKDIKIDGVDKLTSIKIEGLDELKKASLSDKSVGSDISDKLADTLIDFDNRVSNLETSITDKINLIQTNVDDTVSSVDQFGQKNQEDLAELRLELSNTNSSITGINSYIERIKQEIAYTIEEVTRKQNNILTQLYSIRRV